MYTGPLDAVADADAIADVGKELGGTAAGVTVTVPGNCELLLVFILTYQHSI